MSRQIRLLLVLLVELMLQGTLITYLSGVWGRDEARIVYPDGEHVKNYPNSKLSQSHFCSRLLASPW